MILAISPMDPTLQFVFFLIAVICFVLAALGTGFRLALVPLGLAFFAVPFMWNALAAS